MCTQAMIQQASPILHTATYEWAYFRSVHILIPDTWSHIQANLSTWESFQVCKTIKLGFTFIYAPTA